MKKTVITPNDILNQKIAEQATNADGYAKIINALPSEKKSHKVTWIISTIAACLTVAVGLGIYFKTPNAPNKPWYNELVVEDEIFEKYLPKNNGGISNSNRFIPGYDDVDRYIESSAEFKYNFKY